MHVSKLTKVSMFRNCRTKQETPKHVEHTCERSSLSRPFTSARRPTVVVPIQPRYSVLYDGYASTTIMPPTFLELIQQRHLWRGNIKLEQGVSAWWESLQANTQIWTIFSCVHGCSNLRMVILERIADSERNRGFLSAESPINLSSWIFSPRRNETRFKFCHNPLVIMSSYYFLSESVCK